MAHGAEGNLDEAVSAAEGALRSAGLTLAAASLRVRLSRAGWHAPLAGFYSFLIIGGTSGPSY